MSRSIPKIAICPMCHMPVETHAAAFTAKQNGTVRFFCCEGCRGRWLKEKEHPCCARPKGWWGRYLDRMARTNEKVFGTGGPKCH